MIAAQNGAYDVPPETQDGARKPPVFSHDAEAAVCGSVMLVDKAFGGSPIVALAPFLKPDHFYMSAHAEVYRAALHLHERGEILDGNTVAVELRRRGTLDTLGGYPYLVSLLESVHDVAAAETHARTVLRHAQLRMYASLQEAFGRLSQRDDLEMGEAQAIAEELLLKATILEHAGDMTTMGEAAEEVVAGLERFRKNPELMPGLRTGIEDLDKLTHGLQPGTMVLVGGRPASGKSSVVVDVLESMAGMRVTGADGQKRPVHALVFSVEMSRQQLATSMLSNVAGVENQLFRRPEELWDETMTRLGKAAAHISGLDITLYDGSSLTIAQLKAIAQNVHRSHPVDVIFVDYVQLVKDPSQRGPTEEVAAVSQGLVWTARKLDVPVVALTQLSRLIEQRAKKVPVLSDLKQSSQLEQDAHIVVFLHRPSEEEANVPENAVDFYVAKNRDGPLGEFRMIFDGATSRFTRYDPYAEALAYEENISVRPERPDEEDPF
jgi:replicative DNA helicase